jgi:hypothetical protein
MSVLGLHDRERPAEWSRRLLLMRRQLLCRYTVALLLDYLAGGLGTVAAWIAGDGWPE